METTFFLYGVLSIVGCGMLSSLKHILTLLGQEDRLKMAILGEDLLKHDDLDSKDKAIIRFFLDNAFNHFVPIAFAIASPFVAIALFLLTIRNMPKKNTSLTHSDCLRCVFLHFVTRNYFKMAPVATSITLLCLFTVLLLRHQFNLVKKVLFENSVENNIARVEGKILQHRAA